MHCSDACFAYDDEMRAKGHWLSGEAIADASATVSVRIKNGKVSVSDAPFIETKEQLGGVGIIGSEGPERGDCLVVQAPSHGLRRDGI